MKKHIIDAVYIRVEITEFMCPDVKDQERRARRVIEEIKRHVDYVESVYVEHDEHDECEFCGYEWDTFEDGSPACCEDAQNEFNAFISFVEMATSLNGSQ